MECGWVVECGWAVECGRGTHASEHHRHVGPQLRERRERRTDKLGTLRTACLMRLARLLSRILLCHFEREAQLRHDGRRACRLPLRLLECVLECVPMVDELRDHPTQREIDLGLTKLLGGLAVRRAGAHRRERARTQRITRASPVRMSVSAELT